MGVSLSVLVVPFAPVLPSLLFSFSSLRFASFSLISSLFYPLSLYAPPFYLELVDSVETNEILELFAFVCPLSFGVLTPATVRAFTPFSTHRSSMYGSRSTCYVIFSVRLMFDVRSPAIRSRIVEQGSARAYIE